MKQMDTRDITTGWEIPSENYCDQPYIVINRAGDWVCIMTTGPGREGQLGQHIVACISKDQGQTWGNPIGIESSQDTESAYAVPFITPAGRIYAFYNYNGDRIKVGRRNDELGWYVFKFSDDDGQTWSAQRYRIPMRVTKVDRENDFAGKVQLFWGIGKPVAKEGSLYIPYSKIGQYIQEKNEGWIIVSDNILSEVNPDNIHWELRPDGDIGIKNPDFGSVQEEHNIALLDNGDFICIYRTTLGYAAQSVSSDNCRTWSLPVIMPYTPGGRGMKTPRACPMIWKIAPGCYLFWYHNNSFREFGAAHNRNPVWVSGGTERNGQIFWSQPEILLFNPVKNAGMSYPDLVMSDNAFWTTHTNKTIARVNLIDPTLIEGLFTKDTAAVPENGLVFSTGAPDQAIALPELPGLDAGGGFTLSLQICFAGLTGGQVLFDSRQNSGQGIVISISDRQTVKIELISQRHWVAWDTDAGLIQENKICQVTFIIDGSAKVLSIIVDDNLCDGGPQRLYGWSQLPDDIGDVNGSAQALIAPDFSGKINTVHIYDRYLRTSEAIALYQALRKFGSSH